MKIVGVETFILHVPIPRFVADSFNTAITWGLPGVLIRTDEGITGTGYTSTLSHGDAAIKSILDEIYVPKLIGQDPIRNQKIWESSTGPTRTGSAA